MLSKVAIFKIDTSKGTLYSKNSGKRNWPQEPNIPAYPDNEKYMGKQIHSHAYRSPDIFKNQRVLVVGSGKFRAQICRSIKARVYKNGHTTEPHFQADNIDGRHLFEEATIIYFGKTNNVKSKNHTV
jgi:putative flavoprotein involved in K+ transport